MCGFHLNAFHLFAAVGCFIIALSGPALAELPTADDFRDSPGVEETQDEAVSESVTDSSDTPRRSIEVPPASELLDYLKSLPKRKRRMVAREAGSDTEAVALQNLRGISLGRLCPQCDRAIPTRQEFLRMTKRNPADARQIARQCNLSLKGISPLRQLPSGTRQLPIDTRQRPVGTWPR